MKSLKDAITESIMDRGSLDKQVEGSVEWEADMEYALNAITRGIRDEEQACAYEYALYNAWKKMFIKWDKNQYNELQFEKFIAFITYSLNPWGINVSPDDLDPDECTIEDMNWSQRDEWMVRGTMNMIDDMKSSGLKSRLSSMKSSNSAWNFFFDPYYISAIQHVLQENPKALTPVTKYNRELEKVAKQFDLI